MKKDLTEIVFILDRSGSMRGLEGDTIGGYNSMIDKQKTEKGEALISTILFDGQTEVLHDRIPLDKVEPITEKEYYEGTIDVENGSDWNQTAPIDTKPTLDDFKKTVSDYLSYEVSNVLKTQIKEDDRLGK